MKNILALLLLNGILALPSAHAQDALSKGTAALQSMTGCYLVDYHYAETESLKPGYSRDSRVYEVNQNKSVKEWIFAENISPTRLRLQHILFATTLSGEVMDGSYLRHQAEDWEFNAPFLYDFTGPSHWTVKNLAATPSLWTRRITNLDDGLRYQCAASFHFENHYPTWSCDNYAPIPGRETRDMGRKDYNALARSTTVVAYGNSWLERQANIKILDANGSKSPLAKELGKNWYVRLPDLDCAGAKAWAEPQKTFWTVLRESWDRVFTGDRDFVEKPVPGSAGRYSDILNIEEQYSSQDLNDASVRMATEDAIQAIINKYRGN